MANLDMDVARIIGLAALVQYETARMQAENTERDRHGYALAYSGETWDCEEARVLRALLLAHSDA